MVNWCQLCDCVNYEGKKNQKVAQLFWRYPSGSPPREFCVKLRQSSDLETHFGREDHEKKRPQQNVDGKCLVNPSSGNAHHLNKRSRHRRGVPLPMSSGVGVAGQPLQTERQLFRAGV